MKDFGEWSLFYAFDFLLLPVSMYIRLPLVVSQRLFFLVALEEDLHGSAVISGAQWSTPCNVTKPFSLVSTGPSL